MYRLWPREGVGAATMLNGTVLGYVDRPTFAQELKLPVAAL